ncbi:UNVERIFIED_CONTAM: (13S,14R)-1,13-dihydroxy-N-methylcanadine 13-O-acetyltransferase AT1 [Sesamum calycinum]|uniref:(13S,14R)-1,13-dihydroxy-N-methylcanadine 13-O-acetyltransferase AT1 n=1 Tax=Sesamum calycinum TaxID=2727403 RepID=A0AAW2P6B0_9LAMI
MKMEGEIISREHIKPSSPTPLEQRTHKLSLLDQIVPPIYVPLVLYYPNLENTPMDPDFISHTTQILKQSLSSTLTRFYPLAGRIKDKLSIDCNDEGLPFVVTKFNTRLSDFLKNPDAQACRGHIPSPLTWAEPGPGSNVALIQVNFFEWRRSCWFTVLA